MFFSSIQWTCQETWGHVVVFQQTNKAEGLTLYIKLDYNEATIAESAKIHLTPENVPDFNFNASLLVNMANEQNSLDDLAHKPLIGKPWPGCKGFKFFGFKRSFAFQLHSSRSCPRKRSRRRKKSSSLVSAPSTSYLCSKARQKWPSERPSLRRLARLLNLIPPISCSPSSRSSTRSISLSCSKKIFSRPTCWTSLLSPSTRYQTRGTRTPKSTLTPSLCPCPMSMRWVFEFSSFGSFQYTKSTSFCFSVTTLSSFPTAFRRRPLTKWPSRRGGPTLEAYRPWMLSSLSTLFHPRTRTRRKSAIFSPKKTKSSEAWLKRKSRESCGILKETATWAIEQTSSKWT